MKWKCEGRFGRMRAREWIRLAGEHSGMRRIVSNAFGKIAGFAALSTHHILFYCSCETRLRHFRLQAISSDAILFLRA